MRVQNWIGRLFHEIDDRAEAVALDRRLESGRGHAAAAIELARRDHAQTLLVGVRSAEIESGRGRDEQRERYPQPPADPGVPDQDFPVG